MSEASGSNPIGNWDASYYDYAGLIIPGSWLIFVVIILHQKDMPEIVKAFNGYGIGELVFFILAAIVFGHCIKLLSELLADHLWWGFFSGGQPSSWIKRPDNKKVISAEERSIIAKNFGMAPDAVFPDDKWTSMFKEIREEVEASTDNKKHEVLLGNYAMLRGISLSNIIALGFIFNFSNINLWIWLLTLAMTIITVYGMDKYSRLYAQRVFSAYIKQHKTEHKTSVDPA